MPPAADDTSSEFPRMWWPAPAIATRTWGRWLPEPKNEISAVDGRELLVQYLEQLAIIKIDHEMSAGYADDVLAPLLERYSSMATALSPDRDQVPCACT